MYMHQENELMLFYCIVLVERASYFLKTKQNSVLKLFIQLSNVYLLNSKLGSFR